MPSPEHLRLIVSADDFGLSGDTLAATIECFEADALSSASIMPGMPATAAALAWAAARPQHDFGVHLTFTGDFGSRPLAGAERVPSLVEADGRFLSPRSLRLRALAGRLDQQEIERELEAQVRAVTEAGIAVSHVDSHRHVHKFAPFRSALAATLPGLGIRRVRTVQDVFLERRLTSPTYWARHRWGRRISAAFETTEHFFMAAVGDPPWSAPLLDRLDSLGGSLEVGVHPGTEVAWRARDREAVLELAAGLGDRVERVDWRTL